MAEGKVIIVNPDMFGKDPDSKTTKANEVAKSFGLSDAALAEVEDFKAQLTKHNAWLSTHRPVDRYGASMFLHYQRGFNVKFEGIGANQY